MESVHKFLLIKMIGEYYFALNSKCILLNKYNLWLTSLKWN